MASIQKRNGNWRVRYRDDDGHNRSKTFELKRDAKNFAAAVRADKARGEFIDPSRAKTRVSEVAEEWIATRTHLKPKTLSGYRYILESKIVPALGNRAVGSIRRSTVERFLSDLQADGAAAGTVRNIYRVLKMVMDSAVGDDRIKSNPCEGVDLPSSEPREMHFLNAEQVAALAAAAAPPYDVLFYFAAYTGMRFGEIAALRRKRLDLMKGTVQVAESMSEVRGKLHFGKPKSKASRRTIRIPRFLCDMLTEHLAGRDYDPDDLVFRAPQGGPLRHTDFYRRQFRDAADAALPELEGFRFHDLRHTCAALLIHRKAGPKAIQHHLGHSTIAVTFDRYGHLFPDELDRLANELDATYREALAKAPQVADVTRLEA